MSDRTRDDLPPQPVYVPPERPGLDWEWEISKAGGNQWTYRTWAHGHRFYGRGSALFFDTKDAAEAQALADIEAFRLAQQIGVDA